MAFTGYDDDVHNDERLDPDYMSQENVERRISDKQLQTGRSTDESMRAIRQGSYDNSMPGRKQNDYTTGSGDKGSDALNPGELKERELTGDTGDGGYRGRHASNEESNRLGDYQSKHHKGAHQASGDNKDLDLGFYKGKHQAGKFGAGKFDKAKSFLKKHKKKLYAAGIGGSVLIPFILFLLFIAASLKIPHFAENITLWQLNRMMRVHALSVRSVVNEKTAIDTLTNEDYARAAQHYTGNRMFAGINKFRVNKVIQNVQRSGHLDYNYKNAARANGQLTSITVRDGFTSTIIPIKKPGFFNRYIHPVQTFQENLDSYKRVMVALDTAIKLNDPRVPTLIRSLAVKKIMQERLGVSLAGLIASRFKGKTAQQAKAQITQQAYEAINDERAVGSARAQNLNETERNAKAAEKKCITDPKCVANMADNDGQLAEEAADIIEKDLTSAGMRGLMTRLVGIINPIYAAMVPICMVYEGSRVSAPTINAQSAEVMRTGMLVQSTADQQKEGGGRELVTAFLTNNTGSLYKNVGATQATTSGWNAEAAGAMNWKLGDITQTVAMQRAAGNNPDSKSALTTQAAPLGNFSNEHTIFNVVAPPIAGALNSTADALCPTMTNIWVGIGLGVVNLATIIATSIPTGGAGGGAIAAGEAAVEQAAVRGTTTVMSRILTQVSTKQGLKTILSSSGRFGKKFGRDLVVYGGSIAAATFIAKFIVMSHMGSLHNGTAVGPAFGDDADNGVNLVANELCRGVYGCAPLTDEEQKADALDTQQSIVGYVESQSAFDRYLAVGNSTSLISRLATTTSSVFTRNTFASFVNGLASVFNPLTLVPRLLGALNTKATMAAGDVDSLNYDNVQFGWSRKQEQLRQTNLSYFSPSANQKILDDSGKADEISQKYTECLEAPMGDLLESGKIKRDSLGRVKDDDSLCAPHNLGPENKDYQDLVFRWRLTKFYDAGLNTLLGIQAVNVTVK